MSSTLHTFRHAPILAVLLAASFGAYAQATAYKMRIPVGPIAAAAPAPDISIPGYNPVTGTFQSAQGSFTWNGTSYGLPTGTAFGITGPVNLTPAVTADAVKAAIRGNPGSLAGTLAEGWLTGEGLENSLGTWAVLRHKWGHEGSPIQYVFDSPAAAASHQCEVVDAGFWTVRTWRLTEERAGVVECINAGGYIYYRGLSRCDRWIPCAPTQSPAEQADWDALPDPLPTVGAELPYAPYLPAGVAVQNNFTITDLGTGAVHNCTNGGCN